MVFGKSTLTFNTGSNRYVPCFRKSFQFIPCLGVMNPLSGVNHWTFSAGQGLGSGRHIVRGRAGLGAKGRHIVPVVRYFFVHHIQRYFQHHRSRTPVAQLKKCPPQHLWRSLTHDDGLGPLGDVLHVERGIEIRVVVSKSPRIACRNHQYRH